MSPFWEKVTRPLMWADKIISKPFRAIARRMKPATQEKIPQAMPYVWLTAVTSLITCLFIAAPPVVCGSILLAYSSWRYLHDCCEDEIKARQAKEDKVAPVTPPAAPAEGSSLKTQTAAPDFKQAADSAPAAAAAEEKKTAPATPKPPEPKT